MDADGSVRTVVRQSVWIWLLELPVPAMWFVVIGFFGTCWVARLRVVVNGRVMQFGSAAFKR
jgi:hypothetical protein